MNLSNSKPDIRYLFQMKEVLFDQKWAASALEKTELYYMYRGLAENETDRNKIKKTGLRYDITAMPALTLGKEYVKTLGHYHPLASGQNSTYPELYEVLEGEAVFLLQKLNQDKVSDIFWISAKANDKVIVPPDYGHLMINATDKPFKTANWIADGFESIYEPVRQKHGFAYYGLKDEKEKIKWQKNENYQDIPEIREEKPNQFLDKLNLDRNNRIYDLVNSLDVLDFLKNPRS